MSRADAGERVRHQSVDIVIANAVGMKRLIADRGYECQPAARRLCEQDTIPVLPGRRNRKRPIQYDKRRYRDCWWADAMFCGLKDFCRIATRHSQLARNYLSSVACAAAVAFWLD